MSFRDKIKKGARKLFRDENLGALPRATTPPPNHRLQITSPTHSAVAASAALSPPPRIPRPASAPPEPRTSEASLKEDTWRNLTGVLGLLNQNVMFSPLRAVLHELKDLLTLYEDATAASKEYEILQTQLEGLFQDLSSHLTGGAPQVMTTSMLNLCGAIEIELRQIYDNKDRSSIARYLQTDRDLDEIMASYLRIQRHLERLILNVNLSIWIIVDEQATEARLAKITPSMSASYNSAEAALVRRRECTPKTREQVLRDLEAWKNSSGREKICWVNGMAGTGKTTISTTLCSILEKSHELGASFFCTRLLPGCRNVKFILPTLAYQLARFSIPFQVYQKNIVVVIDALDECEDGDGVEQILDVLLEYAPKLPIKFFISSRPEPHTREKIDRSIQKTQLTLHELDEKMVKDDIKTYLRVELASMSLTDTQLAILVEQAGVLFIYASTLVCYIGGAKFSSGRKRLDAVLETSNLRSELSNKTKGIDGLYEAVLMSAINDSSLEYSEREQMELVLHTVVCAQEPLTVDALAELLVLARDEVQAALHPLWSVLNISESSTTNRVGILHASFPDYMLDPNRSKQFACNKIIHNGKLAELCFKRIAQNPIQFNLCRLGSSYVFDKDVPEIENRLNQAIPPDLLYACQYWATHLNLGGESTERVTALHEHLSRRLLLWMEVLNLRNRMEKGLGQMETAISWLQASDCPKNTRLARDARRLVTMFATSPIAKSTPHLYISTLPSWPDHQPMVLQLPVHLPGESQGDANHRAATYPAIQWVKLGIRYTVNSPIYKCA